MKTTRHFNIGGLSSLVVAILFICLAAPFGSLRAEESKKRPNPASKVYFSEIKGDAQISTGERVEDISQRSVYSAEGSVIETRKTEKESDRGQAYSTMVYSNGTGAFFDSDTRVELKRFAQEAFIPNLADRDVEPSIS